MLVGRGGVEPPTFHFSGGRSYQLSYLPERRSPYRSRRGDFESSAAGRSATVVSTAVASASTKAGCGGIVPFYLG
jgi:hypothetical protein